MTSLTDALIPSPLLGALSETENIAKSMRSSESCDNLESCNQHD